MNPIVIDPPNFDEKKTWEECNEWVERHGGIVGVDGVPNMMAAAGADPGICSCPACHENYWMLGRRQRCVKCGFEYPTDAWPMYSYGTQASMKECPYKHEERLSHLYYKYGFEHSAKTPWKEYKRLDWQKIIEEGGAR